MTGKSGCTQTTTQVGASGESWGNTGSLLPVSGKRDFVRLTLGKNLGVSSDAVYRWINKHAMPANCMSRLWKLKKEQVDSWVETGGTAEKDKKRK